MKVVFLAVIAICFMAFASARRWPDRDFPPSSTGPYNPLPPPRDWTSTGPYAPRPRDWTRVKRQAPENGQITIQGTKPLSGPDRRPSLSLDYQHKIIGNDRTNLNGYSGATWQQGSPVQPHVGANFDHKFGRNGNGFVGGFGQVQPGYNGHMQPSFGVRGGFRFRRDLQNEDEETFDLSEE